MDIEHRSHGAQAELYGMVRVCSDVFVVIGRVCRCVDPFYLQFSLPLPWLVYCRVHREVYLPTKECE